jgi:hypothetical protein
MARLTSPGVDQAIKWLLLIDTNVPNQADKGYFNWGHLQVTA